MKTEHIYKAEVGALGQSVAISLTFDDDFVATILTPDRSMIDEIIRSWEEDHEIRIEIIPIDDEE